MSKYDVLVIRKKGKPNKNASYYHPNRPIEVEELIHSDEFKGQIDLNNIPYSGVKLPMGMIQALDDDPYWVRYGDSMEETMKKSNGGEWMYHSDGMLTCRKYSEADLARIRAEEEWEPKDEPVNWIPFVPYYFGFFLFNAILLAILAYCAKIWIWDVVEPVFRAEGWL